MRFSNSSSFKPCNPPKPQDSARPKREEWGTTSDRDPWDSMGQYCKVPYLYPKDLSTWWVFRYISRCFLKNVPKNWCFQWTTFPLSGGTGPLVQNFLFAVLGWISGRGFVVHMPGPTGSPARQVNPVNPLSSSAHPSSRTAMRNSSKNHLVKMCNAMSKPYALLLAPGVPYEDSLKSLSVCNFFSSEASCCHLATSERFWETHSFDVSAKTTSTTPYLSCNQLL